MFDQTPACTQARLLDSGIGIAARSLNSAALGPAFSRIDEP
jgi:hypothetical protein